MILKDKNDSDCGIKFVCFEASNLLALIQTRFIEYVLRVLLQ